LEKTVKLKAKSTYKRLDVFLNDSIKELSRSEISKIILNDKVTLNNKLVQKKNIPVEVNDIIEIIILKKKEFSDGYSPKTELIKLYEDDYFIIINKPSGILVHPGSGRRNETIMDIFHYYYPKTINIPDSDRQGIVHRLDKDTTGILILAKDQNTMKLFQEKFKNREIQKTYTAIVHGKPRFLNGTLNFSIGRSKKNKTKFVVSDEEDAKDAITDYSLIEAFKNSAILELYPKTGRTHQLRVHMAHQKTPIIGDITYGKRDNEKNMFLHASKIEFSHPITNENISVQCPLPQHFKDKLNTFT